MPTSIAKFTNDNNENLMRMLIISLIAFPGLIFRMPVDVFLSSLLNCMCVKIDVPFMTVCFSLTDTVHQNASRHVCVEDMSDPENERIFFFNISFL